MVDTAAGKEVLKITNHENWVLGTIFGVDGKRLVSVSRDQAAKLTDASTGQFIENINALRGELAAIARHPTRDLILIGGTERIPYLYTMDRSASMKIADDSTLIRKFETQDGGVFALAFSPDGSRIAVAGAAVALTAGFAGVTFVRLVGLVVLGPRPRRAHRAEDYGWLGRAGIVVLSAGCLATAALVPLVIRVIAAGLSPVVPAGVTSGALKSPWVVQPVFAGFSILSPSWLWIAMPSLLVTVMAFTWLVSRTRLGRDMRACEQDQTMAALLGVDVDRTISMTFVIGAALAAVAGMMYLLYYGLVDFFMGFVAGIKAFTAAVLGGIGSLPGAMLGGLLIGLIETLWSAYFSVEYKDVAAFSILIIVLIFLPTGLLGRPEVEKV